MKTLIRIEKLETLTRDALTPLEEYYEAVHVVLRDEPQKMQSLLKEPASGLWLAYLDEKPVGCVVLTFSSFDSCCDRAWHGE